MVCGETPDVSELGGREAWPKSRAHAVRGECGGGDAWCGGCAFWVRWRSTIRFSRANGSSARQAGTDCDAGSRATGALAALAFAAPTPAKRSSTRSNAALVCCAEFCRGHGAASLPAGAAALAATAAVGRPPQAAALTAERVLSGRRWSTPGAPTRTESTFTTRSRCGWRGLGWLCAPRSRAILRRRMARSGSSSLVHRPTPRPPLAHIAPAPPEAAAHAPGAVPSTGGSLAAAVSAAGGRARAPAVMTSGLPDRCSSSGGGRGFCRRVLTAHDGNRSACSEDGDGAAWAGVHACSRGSGGICGSRPCAERRFVRRAMRSETPSS
mmetsp:Transcript_8158/g.26906  ORF Transcript_8158/g.26906 Transcript_8158/m.26906 type:complete len:325 (-) Transcript_8158:1569-2543(-)|eukprot:scaffold3499_cov117-Isochrysis_galbana.AAC.21